MTMPRSSSSPTPTDAAPRKTPELSDFLNALGLAQAALDNLILRAQAIAQHVLALHDAAERLRGDSPDDEDAEPDVTGARAVIASRTGPGRAVFAARADAAVAAGAAALDATSTSPAPSTPNA